MKPADFGYKHFLKATYITLYFLFVCGQPPLRRSWYKLAQQFVKKQACCAFRNIVWKLQSCSTIRLFKMRYMITSNISCIYISLYVTTWILILTQHPWYSWIRFMFCYMTVVVYYRFPYQYLLIDTEVIPLFSHWGQVAHICVGKLTIIGSDNGRRQAIIRTNAGMLLIATRETNVNKILIAIHAFSFKKKRGGHFVKASVC